MSQVTKEIPTSPDEAKQVSCVNTLENTDCPLFLRSKCLVMTSN